MHPDFKTALLEKHNTLPWFVVPGASDMLQPVDAGLGHELLLQYGIAMDAWLGKDRNRARWEAAYFPASEQRVLMTLWAAAGWDVVCQKTQVDRCRSL